MSELTAERVRELLEYTPETGVFVWRRPTGMKPAGSIAGCKHKKYVCVQVDGKRYYAHRLAWLYMTGNWPAFEVDHHNTCGTDNSWGNLRKSDRFSNLQNQRRAHRNNSTGLLGVSQFGERFRARIYANGKDVSLGIHASAEDAQAAYVKAKRSLHQGCTL